MWDFLSLNDAVDRQKLGFQASFELLYCYLGDIVISCSLQTFAVDNTAEGGSVRKTKREIVIHHTDIIGDVFWYEHPEILDSWPNGQVAVMVVPDQK